MGAGVSTEGAPLTRVKCKNNLGVLFDPKAEEAFRAAATGAEGAETVPWSEADAYVKTRDERWLDPKHVLFPPSHPLVPNGWTQSSGSPTSYTLSSPQHAH